MDWRQTIADAAQPLLTEPGAVIVALLRDPAEPVSRFYPTADYGDSHRMRGVVWRRAVRLQNEDTVGANYYVVVRYHNDTTIVYNGRDSILWEVGQDDDPSVPDAGEIESAKLYQEGRWH